MDASGEERKKNLLRQRSHVRENKKEVRLSKSILREREREIESISLTLAFMTFFFVLEGRVTEIEKKIKKTKDGKLI
jgi:hypothetical protein